MRAQQCRHELIVGLVARGPKDLVAPTSVAWRTLALALHNFRQANGYEIDFEFSGHCLLIDFALSTPMYCSCAYPAFTLRTLGKNK